MLLWQLFFSLSVSNVRYKTYCRKYIFKSQLIASNVLVFYRCNGLLTAELAWIPPGRDLGQDPFKYSA